MIETVHFLLLLLFFSLSLPPPTYSPEKPLPAVIKLEITGDMTVLLFFFFFPSPFPDIPVG